MADWFEWAIDFEGQKRAEYLYQSIILAFALIGFVVGFQLQSLLLSFQIFAGGVALSALLVLPPWSFYNSHPVQWLEEKKNTTEILNEKLT
ncbi:3663_t:CDS:2 [Ambispora gerdemannii]|uniref:Signal peptidase complex subunit 1 n=1 Tax=Ambispora gerdemannii TaxID=144530 RepID=A0A9N8ZCR1_9GLOM|nr:3663_t:CDS:2 [Ambispora gerdemannii]